MIPSRRTAARRVKVFVGVLAAGLALLPTQAARAGDLSTCTRNKANDTVTLNLGAGDDTVQIIRDGNKITAGTSDCEGATRSNTDLILITDSPGSSHPSPTISLLGGRFAPGHTNEPGRSDEIEFQLQIDSSSSQYDLTITGGPRDDVFRLGASDTPGTFYFNLNADEGRRIDRDVTFDGPLSGLNVGMGDGNDRFSGLGGAGTGGPGYDNGLSVNGHAGRDRILGTALTNFLYGGGGADIVKGLGEEDLVQGNGGDDDLFGGGGPDHLLGDNGDDFLDGGPGADLCEGGSGTNTFQSC